MHDHVTFGYQHAHHMKSAHDVYEQRAGVCRDFAHLALTFCRCMGIPARYCTGYMGDIGIPPDPAPMDFSGWFEAYLSGQWYTFDARHDRAAHRPHPDGHRPRRRRRGADHEFRADGSGEIRRHQRRSGGGVVPRWPLAVIACDKPEAFAQGSASDEAIHVPVIPGRVEDANPESEIPGSMLRIAPE